MNKLAKEKSLLKSKLKEDLPKDFDKKFWQGHPLHSKKQKISLMFPGVLASLFVCAIFVGLQFNNPGSVSEEAYFSYLDEMIQLEEMRYVDTGFGEEDDLSFSERPSL
jgi:hypothetical protein